MPDLHIDIIAQAAGKAWAKTAAGWWPFGKQQAPAQTPKPIAPPAAAPMAPPAAVAAPKLLEPPRVALSDGIYRPPQGSPAPAPIKVPAVPGQNMFDQVGRLNAGAGRWINRMYSPEAIPRTVDYADASQIKETAQEPYARGAAHSLIQEHVARNNAELAYRQDLAQRFKTLGAQPRTAYSLENIQQLYGADKGDNVTTDPTGVWTDPRHNPFADKQPDDLVTTRMQVSSPTRSAPIGPTFGIAPINFMDPNLTGLHELQHVNQGAMVHELPSRKAISRFETNPILGLTAREADGGPPTFQENRMRPNGYAAEPAAVLTELVHGADAARNATGAPVEGQVALTPQYQPKLDWMRQQAQQHNVLSGESTVQDQLNTPAGQAWMRMQYDQLAPAQGHIYDQYMKGNARKLQNMVDIAAEVGGGDGLPEYMRQDLPKYLTKQNSAPDIIAQAVGKAWAKSAKTFYHGSTTPDLATLKSTQPNMGGAGVYGADNIDWAALYALAKDRKGMAVIGGANPKLLIHKDNALLPEGNVYEYDSDKYSPPPESDPNLGWAVPNDVTPTKTHKVKLTDHMRNIEQFADKEALRKRFAELAGKAWAKQAADPNQLVLVSGHSGSGKSTVAQNLATQLGVPKLEIDQHPDFRAFLSNDPHAEHLQRGTEEGGKFKALLQRIANETAQRAPGPAVIAGTQLAHLSPEALAGFPNRLYVSGTRGQVFKQRLERNKANYARKGKAWTPEVEAHKQEMAGKVYDFHAPEVAAYGQLPGTVSYNWHAKNRDAVIAAFRNKLKLDQAQKQADLLPGIQLQEHQQRIADRVAGSNPRMLVYHGLGSGKSLSALAAAEAAQKLDGGSYGIVAPASLKNNFQKEIKKFTTGSTPEVMSYTGLGMGKQFQDQPETLIIDEAARLRNPNSAMTRAAVQAAAQAKRVMLLTGTPITNEPKDLASLISLLQGKQLSPEEFDKQYVGEETVRPGWRGWLSGAKAGVRPVMKNGPALRKLLEGHVDYQPSKTPEGVDVNEQTIRVPLSSEQDKIQKAIRTKVPPGFLWKLDHEFPLSRDELAKLNSFMTGFRQVGLSTQPFRADKSPLKAFQQSSKMQAAFKNLQTTLDSDPRKKAIIYSNFVDAGLNPYSAGLTQAGISHGMFTGSESVKNRQAAVDAYNQNKLRALLIGPAGAEGISTKGTSLIQLMDPHWNEARSQQAQGRGLRFDSHTDLPEELKNVAVQRYLSSSEDPSYLGKLMGYKRERTGDEVLSRLTAEKERLNEQFRQILRDAGTKTSAVDICPVSREQLKSASNPRVPNFITTEPAMSSPENISNMSIAEKCAHITKAVDEKAAYVNTIYPYDANLHKMLDADAHAGLRPMEDNNVPMTPETLVALTAYLRGAHKTPENRMIKARPILPARQTPDNLDAIETLLELENAAPKAKTAQLRNFGAMIANGYSPTAAAQRQEQSKKEARLSHQGLDMAALGVTTGGLGAMGGGLAGLVGGGLHGAISPGNAATYDDQGNVTGQKRRNRLMGALRGGLGYGALGAAGGAAVGGLGGAALEKVRPNTYRGLVGDNLWGSLHAAKELSDGMDDGREYANRFGPPAIPTP